MCCFWRLETGNGCVSSSTGQIERELVECGHDGGLLLSIHSIFRMAVGGGRSSMYPEERGGAFSEDWCFQPGARPGDITQSACAALLRIIVSYRHIFIAGSFLTYAHI
jgi:hypothetical protein